MSRRGLLVVIVLSFALLKLLVEHLAPFVHRFRSWRASRVVAVGFLLLSPFWRCSSSPLLITFLLFLFHLFTLFVGRL